MPERDRRGLAPPASAEGQTAAFVKLIESCFQILANWLANRYKVRMSRTNLVLIIALGYASPGMSHWQYTRWGMSPEQVVAASVGKVNLSDGVAGDSTINGRLRAKGHYVSGDYSFSSRFIFNDRGLSQIVLTPTLMKQCVGIGTDLMARYGAPVEFTKLPMNIFSIRWMDLAEENSIRFNGMSDGSCTVNYMPLNPVKSKSADGL